MVSSMYSIKAHNARHDENVYHRRSIVKAVFFALKYRFG